MSPRTDRLLIVRAIAAFLAYPGIVAYAVPLLLLRPERRPLNRVGLTLAVIGTTLLLACVREFYVAGRGTLAPWSPPRRLVTGGLYRYSRNPMYLSIAVLLAGWAVGYRSGVLALYFAAVVVAFHLRILLHEEPWLARTFGDEWLEYQARTPRWLGFPRRGHIQTPHLG